MKKILLFIVCTFACAVSVNAQTEKLLDICEKNTSNSYKSYNTATSVSMNTTLVVRTSRYTEFYPTLSGKGNLELYCGGERTFLGTKDNKSFPDWSKFTGKIGIYPYKAVDNSAGFYGAVMVTRGKVYSPEDANPDSKINTLLATHKVTLHDGASFATEKAAAGIRIGELNTESGSRMYGYYKTNSSTTSYYLIGSLNTDATLAGRIAAMEKNGSPSTDNPVGIIKEGKGTYTITANDNQISGSLRVNAGTVLVNNDAKTAKSKKMTGGTGAAAKTTLPVAYVFNDARLGGTGNIGGHVDLYGALNPGVAGVGTLYIANYATSAACNLNVHPSSSINCSITDASNFSSLDISGKIVRSNMKQDLTESDAQAKIIVTLADNHDVKVGDTFTLVKATKGRNDAANWSFKVVLPEKLTWSVNEEDGSAYQLTITCTSLEDGEGGNTGGDDAGDEDDTEEDEYAKIDVSGSDIATDLGLYEYLKMTGENKRIGVAIPSWWRYASYSSAPPSYLSTPITKNFNICVAENEMKMDALEPSQNSFSYNDANTVVNYAKNNNLALRGHTLVWHQQVPEWISSDGKKNDKNWTREQLLDIMKNHITTIVKKFGNNVYEWDVVNETLDDDQAIVRTNPNSYQLRKESVWVKVIGEDFIDSAFVYAHRANPNVKLYLNDYDCEYSGVAKTVALFNLAKRLKASGIPIDGVGLQCHLKTEGFDKGKLDATVKKYATIGLNCIFTEIDIAITDNTTANKNKQAEVYGDIAEVFVRNENCPHMVMWGVSDAHSWISEKFPLLFDSNISPKPAYYAVQKALHKYAAVKQMEQETSISNQADVEATEILRYNASGQLITSPCRGINIVKMSDGITRKELR